MFHLKGRDILSARYRSWFSGILLTLYDTLTSQADNRHYPIPIAYIKSSFLTINKEELRGFAAGTMSVRHFNK